jgi:hypothetical protein
MRHLGTGGRIGALVAACAGLAGAGAGCAGDRQQAALDAYERRDYDQAMELAGPRARGSAEAALIAGLAAQAAGEGAQAIVWLAPLRKSTDPQIRGRALAGLGLVALDEGRSVEAAEYLRKAADSLSGQDAARALLLAGDAAAEEGLDGQARTDYQIAQVRAAGAEPLTGQIAARLGGAPAAPKSREPGAGSGD